MNKIRLASHLSTVELERRYRQAAEPHERSGWHMLWLVSRGQTAKAVADSTGYSAFWVGRIVRRYTEQGPDAMSNRQHTRVRQTPSLLASVQLEELRAALAGPAPDGARWSGRVVGEWIAARIGRPVRYQTGWAYLQRLKARQRQPRPRHVAASAHEQEAFTGGSAS